MNFAVIFLVFLPLSVVQGSFFDPHMNEHSSRLLIWRGLESRNRARDFIASGLLIAREDVQMSKFTIPPEPIMGKLNNTYSLYECLTYIKDHRGNHVVMLSVHSVYDMKNVFWTFSKINAAWVWMHVVVLKGPYGAEPPIKMEDVLELNPHFPRYYYIALDMTTELKKPYGYSESELKAFYVTFRYVALRNYPKVMVLDLVHASHTKQFPSDLQKDQGIVSYTFLRQAKGTTLEMVDLAGIHRIIEGVGLDRIYLDVSPDLRYIIMEKYPIGEEPKPTKKSGAIYTHGICKLSLLAWILAVKLLF